MVDGVSSAFKSIARGPQVSAGTYKKVFKRGGGGSKRRTPTVKIQGNKVFINNQGFSVAPSKQAAFIQQQTGGVGSSAQAAIQQAQRLEEQRKIEEKQRLERIRQNELNRLNNLRLDILRSQLDAQKKKELFNKIEEAKRSLVTSKVATQLPAREDFSFKEFLDKKVAAEKEKSKAAKLLFKTGKATERGLQRMAANLDATRSQLKSKESEMLIKIKQHRAGKELTPSEFGKTYGTWTWTIASSVFIDLARGVVTGPIETKNLIKAFAEDPLATVDAIKQYRPDVYGALKDKYNEVLAMDGYDVSEAAIEWVATGVAIRAGEKGVKLGTKPIRDINRKVRGKNKAGLNIFKRLSSPSYGVNLKRNISPAKGISLSKKTRKEIIEILGKGKKGGKKGGVSSKKLSTYKAKLAVKKPIVKKKLSDSFILKRTSKRIKNTKELYAVLRTGNRAAITKFAKKRIKRKVQRKLRRPFDDDDVRRDDDDDDDDDDDKKDEKKKKDKKKDDKKRRRREEKKKDEKKKRQRERRREEEELKLKLKIIAPKGYTKKRLTKATPVYMVKVRRGGRVVSLMAKPLRLNDAKDLLAYYLDRNLVRSGWFKPMGTSKTYVKPPKTIAGYFRKNSRKLSRYKLKGGTSKQTFNGYIEKVKHILDTKTERKQLKKKKKVVRRKKVVKRKKLVKRKPARKKVIKRKVVRRKVVKKTRRRTKKK